MIKDCLLLGSIVGMTVFSGAFLMSNFVFADDSVVDQVGIAVPVSCTMSGTGMNSHNAEINNNTYAPNIGITTLHAFCNDDNGFAIYAAGYTGDEIGGENSTKLVGIPSSIGNIVTGTADNGSTSNWAMKLAITQDSGDTTGTNAVAIDNGFNNYHAVPAAYTKVAHKNTSTEMTESTGGVKLTTTYAVFISQNQSAGTYIGQVIYTLVHPADASAPSAITTSCSTPVPNLTYMQDLNSTNKASVLASMTEDEQYFLKDNRDGKSYCVAKLRDGNIWMTQNLDHDIVTTPNYYTNENTDIGYNSSTNSYETTYWTSTRRTHTPLDTYWCEEFNQYDNSYCSDAMASYDPGNLYWNGQISGYNSENQISNTGITQYHIGNYYSFGAAIATNDISSIAEGTLVDRSICPTGWTLPRPGTGLSSFYNLLNNYGSAYSATLDNRSVWDNPLFFGPMGQMKMERNLRNVEVGHFGNYWTSYVAIEDLGTYLAPVLSIWSEYVGPADYDSVDGGYDYYGLSLRCIARPVSNTVEGFE